MSELTKELIKVFEALNKKIDLLDEMVKVLQIRIEALEWRTK